MNHHHDTFPINLGQEDTRVLDIKAKKEEEKTEREADEGEAEHETESVPADD
jgi:hypothetical protein